MSSQLHFAGIAGSIRSSSHSKSILKAIKGIIPVDASMEYIDISSLPFYK
ncbi:hypothetical protein [Mixta theicola]|nr:hypothetical protein [Mixta theicola]MCQ0603130.1 hypothetical protein [Klebsiella pneumoniae]